MKRPPSASPRSLRGGTFLGFILGLVTGLAVAVGVALFITKAPVPFVNRPNVKVGPDTPGAPPDPNKPFYGRDGGMPSATVAPPAQPAPVQPAPGQTAQPPAAQPTQPAPGQTAQTAPGQPAGARPAQPQGDRQFSFYDLMPGRKPGETPAAPTGAAAGQPVPPAAQTSGAPAGQQAAPASRPAPAPGNVAIPAPGAAPATAPAAQTATAPETRYLLQAGAFRNEADADAMRARLALLGYDARVSPREGAGDPIYRVRIGPVTKLDDLNRMRQSLAQNGIDASVVRAP